MATPNFPLKPPPIAAFHSFKGGGGRTTHAIGLSLAASANRKVLLIDADVEAPGISWLLRDRIPQPSVSFADLIALAHGDASEGHQQTVSLVADRLKNLLVDGCYVLPAFRSLNRLQFLEIRPEHLLRGQPDPFLLTHLINAVGQELGVGLIVIDLRAGFSELAAGLLLDPRVHRVFVTTLGGQSMEGTLALLQAVGCKSPSDKEEQPYPAIIVNQIPEGLRGEDWRNQFERLVEATAYFVKAGEQTEDFSPADPIILESGFDRSLQIAAADWEKGIGLIRNAAGVSSVSKTLLEWLPVQQVAKATEGSAHNVSSSSSRKSRRELLADSAGKMIFAERQVSDSFLQTRPLRTLAADNMSQLPVAVIIGAKGAGKTFTFLQQIRVGSWTAFVKAAIGQTPAIDARFVPTLFSNNLSEVSLKTVLEARKAAAQHFSFDEPVQPTEIQDMIRAWLPLGLSETAWREKWLDCIAWSAGFKSKQSGAGKLLASALDQGNNRLIAVFDGLEDIFQALGDDTNQQIALRSLLQDVPMWLNQNPSRSLAVLVYVRSDLVNLAVRQNHAQLLDRYSPYRLEWNSNEALRLTNWVWTQALNKKDTPSSQDAEEIKEILFPLWGRKLGSDESREARSADWVLDALSDCNNQIQARDLVRFISIAAQKSIADNRWSDRDLVPQAIKDALPECSREKVEEIKKENDELKRVFEKLEKVPQSERLIPFDSTLTELDNNDFRVLIEGGALLNDGGSYYLPEIYLHGLGFRYSKPGRRRIHWKTRR